MSSLLKLLRNLPLDASLLEPSGVQATGAGGLVTPCLCRDLGGCCSVLPEDCSMWH